MSFPSNTSAATAPGPFADGTVRVVDLEDKLSGSVGTVFEPLREVMFYAPATVDAEVGTVVWPNGADLAPEALHDGSFDPVFPPDTGQRR